MEKITLCGSTKFKEAFEYWNKKLSLEGNVVYSVSCFGHSGDNLTYSQKELLDKVHFSKIDNSDEIFVLDVDGYIGESTNNEILYAKLQGKRITFLSSKINKK